MLLNTFVGWITVMLSLPLAGCMATFEPRLNPSSLEQPHLPNVRTVQNGVAVAVEEFFSSHKSRRAFDADLAAGGVLALFIHVNNQSAREYRIERRRIEASWNERWLTPIAGITAAEVAALRNPAWNALVNTAAIGPLAMFFGVATMAASANQAQKINRQIVHHFERMELTDRVLKPDESATGFVFFQMPSSVMGLGGLSLQIILEPEMVGDRPGASLSYHLPLPPLHRALAPDEALGR